MSDEQQNHDCGGKQALHVEQSRTLLDLSRRPLPTHQSSGYRQHPHQSNGNPEYQCVLIHHQAMNDARYQCGYAEKSVDGEHLLVQGIEALETILLLSLLEVLADSG